VSNFQAVSAFAFDEGYTNSSSLSSVQNISVSIGSNWLGVFRDLGVKNPWY
jgi:hypothetical protein